MAITTVKITIDGQEYALTYSYGSGKWKATLTAPGKSSYNQMGHYYNVTVLEDYHKYRRRNMEILNYIVENARILIPALVILGAIVKHITVIPDKFVPLILLVFGISGALVPMEPTVDAAIQGILVTGAAYGNQIVKQLGKSDDQNKPETPSRGLRFFFGLCGFYISRFFDLHFI